MRRKQRGIALVLVLWVITLLAVIAGNFAFSMRGEAKIARNLLSTAQAKAQADAGIHRAWYELLKSPNDLQRWKGDGVAHEIALPEAELRVTIQDESGKINLNTASEPLLKGLFRSAGLSEDASVALIDAVVDWRDADKLKRLHGAEEEDYRAAGKSYVPSNAAFETVNELRRVLGMSPEVYRVIAPALTIYSQLPGINSAAAPREVLLALPGVNPAQVEQYLVQRESQLASGQNALPFAGTGAFESPSAGLSAFSIRSAVKMADGTMFARQAIVRRSQDAKHPLVVLAWGEGDAEQ